jgi:hypothetical protein
VISPIHLRYSRAEFYAFAGIVILCAVLASVAGVLLPSGIDWHLTFRPASLALLSGGSPFQVNGLYSAPWGLLPLLPFALLPEGAGRGSLFILALLSYLLVARRLGGKSLVVGAFMLSPPVIHGLLNANIDWLAMLGFILPPQIGLLFIMIKPQIGIGLAVFWLAEAWQEGRMKKVFHVFWPVATLSLVSFGLYGFWPLRFLRLGDPAAEYSASFWPYSIPIGLILLTTAIRKRGSRYAIAASPCLSPHVVFHSYAGALAALVPATAETIAAVISLWILVIFRLAIGGY